MSVRLHGEVMHGVGEHVHVAGVAGLGCVVGQTQQRGALVVERRTQPQLDGRLDTQAPPHVGELLAHCQRRAGQHHGLLLRKESCVQPRGHLERRTTQADRTVESAQPVHGLRLWAGHEPRYLRTDLASAANPLDDLTFAVVEAGQALAGE